VIQDYVRSHAQVEIRRRNAKPMELPEVVYDHRYSTLSGAGFTRNEHGST
jgi:hypothetical protein